MLLRARRHARGRRARTRHEPSRRNRAARRDGPAPQIAIITNIGTAHIEHMKTRAAIALEKGMLAEAVDPDGCVILHAGDDYTPAIAARAAARVVTVGIDSGELRAENFRQTAEGSRFDRGHRHGPDRGDAAGGRAATWRSTPCSRWPPRRPAAWLWRRRFTVWAAPSLTNGRLELKQLGGWRILDDTYNANPDSMVAALQTLARLPSPGRRIAVSGPDGRTGSRSRGRAPARGRSRRRGKASIRLIGVGPEARIIVESARAAGLRDAVAVETTEEAAALLAESARTRRHHPRQGQPVRRAWSGLSPTLAATLTSQPTDPTHPTAP